jgi:hypothetical protein
MSIDRWAFVLSGHCLRHWLLTQRRKSVNMAQLPGGAHIPPLECPDMRAQAVVAARFPCRVGQLHDPVAKSLRAICEGWR